MSSLGNAHRVFWFIWLIAIIYQAKLIWYVKDRLREPLMVIFWLSCLTIWFLLFSINNSFWAIFFIIALFCCLLAFCLPFSLTLTLAFYANSYMKVPPTLAFCLLGYCVNPFNENMQGRVQRENLPVMCVLLSQQRSLSIFQILSSSVYIHMSGASSLCSILAKSDE